MSTYHEMPDVDFRDLASGRGSAAAVHQLIDGQRTLRRTLLMAVYQAANARRRGRCGPHRLRAAWDVLAAVDAEHPEALDRVLDHPFVRFWAVRCYRPALHHRSSAPGADLGYLSALAASAAVRAGVAAELSVPVVDGVVLLPTLGRLVPGPDPRRARDRAS